MKSVIFGATTLAVAAGLGLYTWQTSMTDSQPCGDTAVAGSAIGGPFELVSETGETVTDVDVITKPTLVYFGYTFCPDVCPLDSAPLIAPAMPKPPICCKTAGSTLAPSLFRLIHSVIRSTSCATSPITFTRT